VCATSHRRRYGPAYASIVFTRLEGCAPGLGCRESAEVVTLASILKAIRSEPGRGAAVRHVQAFDDRALEEFGISRCEFSPAARREP
jgi:hypothetical protein